MLKKCLSRAGYTHLIPTTNGQEAWDTLQKILADGGKVGTDIALVITDIEMPQMDGHHLTKLIKDDPRFDGMPVVIFSSLVNDEMKRKGEIPRHTHTVIVSTAHPYKFPGIVAKSLGLTPKDDPYDTLRMIAEKTGIAIPRQLGELESREKRFTDVVDRTEMAESIERYVDEICEKD